MPERKLFGTRFTHTQHLSGQAFLCRFFRTSAANSQFLYNLIYIRSTYPGGDHMYPKGKQFIVNGDADKPIPADVYPVIDTDLARDNLENDLPAADLEDL